MYAYKDVKDDMNAESFDLRTQLDGADQIVSVQFEVIDACS